MIIGFGGLHYCCCLSWLGWYPCPHRSSRLTRWPRDSYAIQQRPPLKSKGSHLVQGCYGLPLHVPLNFILGRLTRQTNWSEPWGHGRSTVVLNMSFLFPAWGHLYGNPWWWILKLNLFYLVISQLKSMSQGQMWRQIPAEVNLGTPDIMASTRAPLHLICFFFPFGPFPTTLKTHFIPGWHGSLRHREGVVVVFCPQLIALSVDLGAVAWLSTPAI